MKQKDKKIATTIIFFKEFIHNNNMSILNTPPTCDNHHNTPSTLDHIITTHPQHHNNTTLIETHFSDHKLISTQRNYKAPVSTPRYYNTQNLRDINEIEMNHFLSQHPQNCPSNSICCSRSTQLTKDKIFNFSFSTLTTNQVIILMKDINPSMSTKG